MINQREHNPHFVTPPLSPPLVSPQPQQPSSSRRPKRASSHHGRANKQPAILDPTLIPTYVPPQPHPTSQPQPYLQRHQPRPEATMHPGTKHPIDQEGQLRQQPGTLNSGEPVQSQESQLHSAGNRQQQAQQHRGRHNNSGQQGYRHRHPSVRVPGSGKTRPVAWLVAALCTLFWIIVIVVGLAILIIYLVFRPHLPKFDIPSATLNAAYLDMGKLNADFTILGNFTNPNKKVNVDFHYVVLDLYQNQALLARRYLEPFTTVKRHSRFVVIHMIASQVPLTLRHSQELRRQMAIGKAMFDVKGVIRARSKLGFLRYSYWLYSHCTITMTGPPTGVMIAKTCTTKR